MSYLGKCNNGLCSGLSGYQNGRATMEEEVWKLRHRVRVLERSLESETKFSQDLYTEVCQKTYCLEQLGKYTHFSHSIHVCCCTWSTTLVILMPKDLLNLWYCFRGALQPDRKSGRETGRAPWPSRWTATMPRETIGNWAVPYSVGSSHWISPRSVALLFICLLSITLFSQNGKQANCFQLSVKTSKRRRLRRLYAPWRKTTLQCHT